MINEKTAVKFLLDCAEDEFLDALELIVSVRASARVEGSVKGKEVFIDKQLSYRNDLACKIHEKLFMRR